MIPELLPCPLCGAIAVYAREDGKHVISCKECLARIVDGSLENIVERWNARCTNQEDE